MGVVKENRKVDRKRDGGYILHVPRNLTMPPGVAPNLRRASYLPGGEYSVVACDLEHVTIVLALRNGRTQIVTIPAEVLGECRMVPVRPIHALFVSVWALRFRFLARLLGRRAARLLASRQAVKLVFPDDVVLTVAFMRHFVRALLREGLGREVVLDHIFLKTPGVARGGEGLLVRALVECDPGIDGEEDIWNEYPNVHKVLGMLNYHAHRTIASSMEGIGHAERG